jgi:predicted MFS family arabinose efflux permease
MILVLLGLIVSAFALSRWLPLSCVLMLLGGAAIMASASFMLSLAQLITTDAMRGRVMSVYNLAFRTGIPLGALVIGKLIPIFGVSKVLTVAGLSLVAISLYFLPVKQDATFHRDSEKA